MAFYRIFKRNCDWRIISPENIKENFAIADVRLVENETNRFIDRRKSEQTPLRTAVHLKNIHMFDLFFQPDHYYRTVF